MMTDDKAFYALELIDWDGTTPICCRGDEWYFSFSEALDEIEDRGVDELDCYLGELVPPPEIDIDIFSDHEDAGRSKEVAYLCDELNDRIAEFFKRYPLWTRGTKRVCIHREETK